MSRLSGEYNKQIKLPAKDNRTIYDNPLPGDGYWDGSISIGPYIEYCDVVRVPSLKRKSAWKRFYKLFPHLIGKKIISGSSRSWSEFGKNYLNKSTIKLKKIKKK